MDNPNSTLWPSETAAISYAKRRSTWAWDSQDPGPNGTRLMLKTNELLNDDDKSS